MQILRKQPKCGETVVSAQTLSQVRFSNYVCKYVCNPTNGNEFLYISVRWRLDTFVPTLPMHPPKVPDLDFYHQPITNNIPKQQT